MWGLLIMRYFYPDDYDDFRCTAGACEDTCCAQWQIVVDAASLKRYRKVRGPFRKRLRQSIDWKQGLILQTPQRRCVFLNEGNLCDLQTALGGDALCDTCRLYPRHIEEFENVRELTLSVSCPEAARMLLSRQKPMAFRMKETEETETYPDFDLLLYDKLVEAREVMDGILKKESYPIPVRAGLILGLAHDLQGRILHRNIFSAEEVFEKYQTGAATKFVADRLAAWEADEASVYQFARDTFAGLFQMEVLNESWLIARQETMDFLFTDAAAYGRIRRSFQQWQKKHLPWWEMQSELILQYFLYTYFCGAVYDGKPYPKIRMAVESLFFIQQMMMSRWVKNEGTLDEEEVRDIVCRYSREIEHSDENLALMDAPRSPRFL